jgi:hypothetical protein
MQHAPCSEKKITHTLKLVAVLLTPAFGCLHSYTNNPIADGEACVLGFVCFNPELTSLLGTPQLLQTVTDCIGTLLTATPTAEIYL